MLYQLPTGGGKTVIFSEIVRQYLKTHKKHVLVMTHRIELCKQTSSMLTEFGVKNKVIDSKAKLDDIKKEITIIKSQKSMIRAKIFPISMINRYYFILIIRK